MILSGKARVAGVIGWPVGHSRSPALHGYWLALYGIDGAYVPLPVPPDKLATAVRALPALGFAGINVTVPHKEGCLALVDQVDPAARRIGAVNTIVVNDDGTLSGSNTDAFGFMESLRDTTPDWAPRGPAVVIGAGGAARAVCVALSDAGAAVIRLINRTMSRAESMAESLGLAAEIVPWTDRSAALDGAGLLVNTTTLGMVGQPALDLDLAALPTDALVTDIVYAPLMTPLLVAAKARGNTVVDGLGMLLHQGRPGFAAWFGRAPDVTMALRAAVLDSGR